MSDPTRTVFIAVAILSFVASVALTVVDRLRK